MKKTIYTVMTAAMFAAANLSSLPVGASENEALNRPKVDPVETITLSDSELDLKKGYENEQKDPVTTTTLTNLTNRTTQTLYGAPWMFGTTTTPTTSDLDFLTTTTTQPLYGPPWVFSSTTTTVSDPDDGENVDLRMKGDVNGDDIVDTFDAIALRRAILFDEYKDKRAKLLSDINSDGKIDVSDLVLLQRFLLGAIKDFREYDNSSIKTTKTTAKLKDDPIFTTETTTYDPRGDVVISLYGIKPSIEITKEAVEQAVRDIEDAGAILDESEREEEED